MQNINELVLRNLKRADQFAVNQEIQRSIVADVRFFSFFLLLLLHNYYSVVM